MTSATEQASLRVTRMTWEADGVVTLTLMDPAGGELPAWAPGAHVELRLPSGLARQYSLCGDPRDRTGYTIAVRRAADSRGGSAEIHSTALIGREIAVTSVRNRFPLGAADEYLLVAGGIGVTPLLPMAAALAEAGAAWSALYCGHGAETMPFRDTLTALGGDRVRIVDTATEARPDLKEAIHRLGPGGAVYCCGPNGLIDAVAAACSSAGIRCESEYFGAATLVADGVDDDVVELDLRRSGVQLVVDPGTTLLDAIRDAGVDGSPTARRATAARARRASSTACPTSATSCSPRPNGPRATRSCPASAARAAGDSSSTCDVPAPAFVERVRSRNRLAR